MIAVVSIFGIAWMSDTFVNGNSTYLISNIKQMVEYAPWTFGLAMLTIMIPFGLVLRPPGLFSLPLLPLGSVKR